MAVDKNMNILIVDDYKTIIRIVRGLMSDLGFPNVDDAANGQAALELARSKTYGLILSDWNMQPMTGLELLVALKSDPKTSSIPFIMITAETKTENVVAARKAGASQYVIKPFNLAVLRQKLTSVLGDLS